jgi:hypothetical protein
LHNLDIPAIVCRLNLKPFIRIETGMFISYLEDQQYLLGMTGEGIASAVQRMTRLCGEDRFIAFSHRRMSLNEGGEDG